MAIAGAAGISGDAHMIESAAEFARLRMSDDPAEQARATHDAAEEGVWRAVIVHTPELKIWIARNKSVQMEILHLLAADADPRVRREVAAKRKLDLALFVALANDPDESVRRAIALNAKCPARIKEGMNDE